MKEMMHRDFDFEIDGVLFYHASVHYLKGQSPLGLLFFHLIIIFNSIVRTSLSLNVPWLVIVVLLLMCGYPVQFT